MEGAAGLAVQRCYMEEGWWSRSPVVSLRTHLFSRQGRHACPLNLPLLMDPRVGLEPTRTWFKAKLPYLVAQRGMIVYTRLTRNMITRINAIIARISTIPIFSLLVVLGRVELPSVRLSSASLTIRPQDVRHLIVSNNCPVVYPKAGCRTILGPPKMAAPPLGLRPRTGPVVMNSRQLFITC